MMDYNSYKDSVINEFESYTSDFDRSDSRIALKVEHTYKVAAIAEKIGLSLSKLSRKEVFFCWLLGMLHDIGRFRQLREYGTYLDAESVDHAELGADILFKEKLIDRFIKEPVTKITAEDEKHLIELAIRQHNKFAIPEYLSEKERMFCNILRDADKIDIFRVTQEIPFEIRMTKSLNQQDTSPAREEVMNCVRNRSSVPRISGRNSFEVHISGCAMAFELIFDKSRELAKEQGFLKQMLSYDPPGQEQKKQMEELRREMSYIC